jgi:hypothetical protein
VAWIFTGLHDKKNFILLNFWKTMLNREEALGKLSAARDYEEKIAEDLNSYYLTFLDEVKGLSEEEKQEVIPVLKTIIRESWMHNAKFTMLIERVLASDKNIF